MPRKTASGAGKRKDARQAIIENALTLAASRGWARVGLGDMAEAAEVSLAELREEFSSKSAIVAAYAAAIDREVLAARDPEMAGRPATQRLFDVFMKRFDLLNAPEGGSRRDHAELPVGPGSDRVRAGHAAAFDALDARSRRLEQCWFARPASVPRHCPRSTSPCFRSGSATTVKTWRAPWPCSTGGSGDSTRSRAHSAVSRRGATGAIPSLRRKPDRVRRCARLDGQPKLGA